MALVAVIIAVVFGLVPTGCVSASEHPDKAVPVIEHKHAELSSQNPRTELIIAQAPGMLPMTWDVNLPGLDFATFQQPVDDPRWCEERCAGEPQCRAWTYVHPGFQGPGPRCWLKYAIPRPVRDGCCVSGVKQTGREAGREPRLRSEPNLNLPGRDYADFNLPDADPGLCQNECRRDPRCQAWTYVRPGFQGPWPRCWLKDAKPPRPVLDPCCVSGWKEP